MAIAERWDAVRQQVAAVCDRCGRDPSSVTIVAVTKQRSIDEIKEVLRAGATNIGENYVQDAVAKFGMIGTGATWHFIGHLQRNKVRAALEFADVIHSVDSLRIGQEIARRAEAQGKAQRVLLEVNVSGEPSKYGVAEQGVAEIAAGLRDRPGVRVEGLMTMAPLVDDPEQVRPVFAQTRELARRLASEGLLPTEPALSMGMTNDFEVAIEEGATMVRIGTAIFGQRHSA